MTIRMVREKDGTYLVWPDEVLIHGNGNTLEEAMDDLRVVFEEYKEILADFVRDGAFVDPAELQCVSQYMVPETAQ